MKSGKEVYIQRDMQIQANTKIEKGIRHKQTTDIQINEWNIKLIFASWQVPKFQCSNAATKGDGR